MTIRTALSILLALAVIPAAANAAEITVWEHVDFRGDSETFDNATSRLDDDGWNDRISSIRIVSGQWEICRDNDYRSCRTFSTNAELAELDSGWNDAISSLRPLGSSTASANPENVAARLYVALLGREADPEGLRNATSEVSAGRLADLVRGLTQSQEFRNISRERTPSELLDMIYRGLLGRAPDTAARTAYLNRIEDGEVADVVLDLVESEEFASAGTTAVAAASEPAATGSELRTRGRGEGVMIRGPRNQTETINSVKVHFGPDGRFRMTFAGSAPHVLEGTYTRESHDFVRIDTIDGAGGALDADGGITLSDREWLGRIDVQAGTPGTRDHVVYQFVAESFVQTGELGACQDAIRTQIGGGARLLFLAPHHSRIGSQRQEFRGTVVNLSNNTSSEYSCDVGRGGQVLNASLN